MAEAKEKPQQPAKEAAAAPAPAAAKGKPPLKMILTVAALMAVEAAGVYVLVGMSGSRAKTASAEIKGEEKSALVEPIEIELMDEKFQNMQTGRVWIWDTQIVLKTKKKNEPFIEEELTKRSAEIKEGIAQIMRRAQHSHLREPELTTLNRQLTAYLDKTFGPDADGATRVDRVLIPKCKGFQMEQ